MTDKWRRKAEIYKRFALSFFPDIKYDFSDQAAREVFEFESKGIGYISIDGFNQTFNGYAIGKKWCDVQVSMWLEDLKKPGWINLLEDLYSCKKFPMWWLDSIFRGFLKEKDREYRDLLGEDGKVCGRGVYERFEDMKMACVK